MSQYPTNLTDKQWQVTEIILDPQHRKRKYSLRDIMDAIMYIVKTGCQWRMLPSTKACKTQSTQKEHYGLRKVAASNSCSLMSNAWNKTLWE